MRHFKFSLALALLLACNLASAHKATETLSSPNSDKVSITYEILQNNGKVTICFTNVRKTIGNHGRKYQNPDEIVVLFFDRKGGYDSDVHFSGEINTNPFTIPAGLEYKKSEDGFFIIGQSTPPKLTFEMTASAAVDLSIPIYLAWHPKRGKYEVFQHCGNLDIAIAPETTPQKKGSQQKTVEYAVEDEESSFSFEDEARQRIAHINALLAYQEDSFSPELVNEIACLNALKAKINDKRILTEIDETLERCDEKRDEIKQQAQQRENANKQEEAKAIEDAEFRNCRTAEDYDHFLKLYPNSEHKAEAEKNRDELKQEKENETKKQQKRTIWIIIGGGLMAALLFVGNQVMQSVRNIKTQRSIMEMQQDVTRRATGTAKRRAKSVLHNKTHEAMNATRNKGRDLMQKGTEKAKTINLKKKDGGSTQANGNTNKTKTKTNGNKQISI